MLANSQKSPVSTQQINVAKFVEDKLYFSYKKIMNPSLMYKLELNYNCSIMTISSKIIVGAVKINNNVLEYFV